ncbi:MAG TPA: isochorismatase family cysteine hydrolase [Solirubrobacteraceae bacterium]
MPTTVDIPEYEVRKRVTLDPARTALVIIDMQNDFVRDEGTLQVKDAPATVPAISHLLELARESGMRVVFSKDTHDAGDPEFDIWPAHALRGTWGWEMIDELAPREGELVVQKVRYDAFYGTELDHMLSLWDVKTIVLCGTVANICVHYTAASAALRWYDVVIPKDAVSAVERCDLEFSLRQTSWLFQGTITTSQGVVARKRRAARAAAKA